MKKILINFAAILSAAIISLVPSISPAQSIGATDSQHKPSYSLTDNMIIQDFHSNIAIHQNSSFTVEESIIADFTKATLRHGIYRYIPINYKDRLGQNLSLRFSLISVTDENNHPLTTSTTYDGEKINLRIGDSDIYVDGKVLTYRIKYRLDRGINQFPDHDELYWNVTGNGWNNTILKASATIKLPSQVDSKTLQSTCYTGVGYSKEQDCDSTVVDGQTFQFSTKNSLSNNAGLTIVTGFPKKLLTYPGPLTYVTWFIQDNWGYLIPLFVFLFLYYRWYKYGRDPKALHTTIMPEYDPPNNLRPGEIGTLLDDRVDMQDITATIIDLASRGWLKIIETKKKGLFSGSFNYSLEKTVPKNSLEKLLDYENIIYTGIFHNQEKIKLDDLKHSFYKKIPDIKEKIYKRMVKQKYYESNPENERNRYFSIAGTGFFITLFFLGFLIDINLSIFLGILLSFLIIGVFGFYMPKKSQLGADTLIHILGLEEFIKTAEQDRLKFYEKENIFEKILPYAIALGLADKWAKACEGLMKTAPDWYESSDPNLMNHFNTYYFLRSLNTFNNTMSTNMNTAPRSAASSGSSGFSSGGGFSGGGFGGGGGGSW